MQPRQTNTFLSQNSPITYENEGTSYNNYPGGRGTEGIPRSGGWMGIDDDDDHEDLGHRQELGGMND